MRKNPRFCTTQILLLAFALGVLPPAGQTAAREAKTASGSEVTLVINGGEDPEALARTLDILKRSGKNVILRIGDKNAETGPEVKAKEKPPLPEAADPGDNLFMRSVALFTTGFDEGNRQVPAITRIPAQWAANWGHNRNGSQGVSASFLIFTVVALSLAVAGALRWLMAGWARRHGLPRDARISRRFYAASAILACDLAAILGFAAMGRYASPVLLPEPDLARKLADGIGWVIIALLLYAAAGRFLLAPHDSIRRLLPMPHAKHQFWMLVLYGTLGPAVVISIGLAGAAGGDSDAVTGWATLVAAVITLYKVFWFWTGRRDIAGLVMAGAQHDGGRSRPLHRLLALGAPWLLIGSAVVIWVLGRAATVMDDGSQWSSAAGVTQVLIIGVPIAAFGVRALLACLLHARDGETPREPWLRALSASAVRAGGGLVWLTGALVMTRLWAPLFGDLPVADRSAQLAQVMGLAAFAFAGWLFWAFLKSFFDCYAPKPGHAGVLDEDAGGQDEIPSRLATVLPVLRGLVLGSVAGLTILFCLSRMGVDISPLLAGFGILGLAISFGSQSLVRDIVSGMFFMVEDAFRVGEYVDTGRLKGTVEKISLRSMQLRHQSGLIHTVPFGQVTSVTNASRDWSTVKFNLRLDHGADIEKARKTIKKTGLAMLEDHELGGHFITPLKMQGVSDISDTAIIVRLKFTAKPAQSSLLQREALKRLYSALPQSGVHFASNQVTVRGGQDGRGAAGAAAMQSQLPAGQPSSG